MAIGKCFSDDEFELQVYRNKAGTVTIETKSITDGTHSRVALSDYEAKELIQELRRAIADK